MNWRLFVIISLGVLTGAHAAQVEHTLQYLDRYDLKQENAIRIPVDFAGHFIVDQSELKKLQGNKIVHVDLVYTAYKESPDFDQDLLNSNRVSELQQKVPQVVSDQPEWNFVEQTGAVTRQEARTYFHGFVIHYTKGMEYDQLKSYFSEWSEQPESFEVNNQEQQTFTYDSGTKLTVEPGSVVDQNGKPVQGSYELNYREYRNAADIVLSGIPMNYSDPMGNAYHFNSVGMYELTATQNGEPLTLVKPIRVDFNCTQQAEGVSFYRMDENGVWENLQPISFRQAEEESSDKQSNIAEVKLESSLIRPLDASVSKESSTMSTTWKFDDGRPAIKVNTVPKGENDESQLNEAAWVEYERLKKEDSKKFLDLVVKEDPGERILTIVRNGHMRLVYLLAGLGSFIGGAVSAVPIFSGNNENYNTTIKGLSSAGFGVYNCDQVMRLANRVTLNPIYFDKNSGQEISKKYLACLVDLGINSSFTYHPNLVTCNSKGRNVLLLFTDDKRIYYLDEAGFAALPKSDTAPRMEMVEVTDKIQSPNDLKNLLGI